MSCVLVATWGEGLFVLRDGVFGREIHENLTGLTSDGAGGALAIVGGLEVKQRSAAGAWTAIAKSDVELAACTTLGDAIFVGTNDARVFRVVDGTLVACAGFEDVEGRARWYAGTAVVDGRVVGPPLGVRSMTGTSDGSTLLVNVHVGGIPRSVDGGATWTATIDLEWDAHEVCAHPTRPELVAAALGVGLALSRDHGVTWTLDDVGLHAKHCSAVAFVDDEVWVSASTSPFAKDGAVYRRALDGPLRPVALPENGRVDTGSIAARGDEIVIADTSGRVFRSVDRGASWTRVASDLPYPTGVLIL